MIDKSKGAYSLQLLKFLNKHNIQPKTLSHYVEALTHKSYANENNSKRNYERLEFFGDAAIHWILTNFVFRYEYKNENLNSQNSSLSEAEMTQVRANLEEGKMLSKAAVCLGLDKFILIGNGLKDDINARMEKIYEDVFEAFVGAIIYDQGIKKAERFLEENLIKYFLNGEITFSKDPKTLFQELVQAKSAKKEIKYVLNEQNKEAKEIHLYWNDLKYGIGVANNRKEAEILAAKDALSKITKEK